MGRRQPDGSIKEIFKYFRYVTVFKHTPMVLNVI